MKLRDTYEIFVKFNNCCSILEVNKVINELLGVYGVEYYFVGSMPPKGASQIDNAKHVLGNLLPEVWVNRYFRHNFVDADPTIHHVRMSNDILNWNKIVNSNKKAAMVMGEAASIGMRQGVTIPQFSLDNTKIGVSFSGDRLDLDNPTMEIYATVVGAYLVSALFKTGKRVSPNPDLSLTSREKDVLYWISEGYTSAQIAEVMGISRATVEKHYRQVLEKFDCKTRSHVIAEAFRNKLIT